jgi:hypothetical protein
MSDVQQEEAPRWVDTVSASGSALLGLDGFQLVSAELQGGEWQLAVQTMATVVAA